MTDPMRVIEHISRVKVFPDDKINRVTLTAAIEMARTVMASHLAIERVQNTTQEKT